MKAAITPTYGPANIIENRLVAVPEVGPRDVLVRVYAAPVTAGDCRLRSADFPGISALPGRLMMGVFAPRASVQGTMFSGRVVSVGDKVKDYQVGDDVFGSADSGAYAEYLSVKDDGPLAKVPRGVTYDEAAAVPYGAVTAMHFLRDLGDIKQGDKVLIVGASGGVGRYAVQLAKHMGAEVTGVASQKNAAMVRELGADHVIDYSEQDFTENGQQYDVILDIADATSFSRSRQSLTASGRYLTLFISLRAIFWMIASSLLGGAKAKFGVALGGREDIQHLAKLLADGVITPMVGRKFSLANITDAHLEAERGGGQGSVMVMI